jgi:hypothetical protein
VIERYGTSEQWLDHDVGEHCLLSCGQPGLRTRDLHERVLCAYRRPDVEYGAPPKISSSVSFGSAIS